MQSTNDKISPHPRLCNACGGRHFTLMGRRSDGVEVMCCQACGLGVTAIVPADLASLYDDAYYGLGAGKPAIGYQDYRFTAEHGLSWAAAMARLIKRGGRVLDIGCADGVLLAKLANNFELYGIEVNSAMAARAAAIGTTIIGNDLLAPNVVSRYRGFFDIVTAIAVFEHLADLRRGIEVALELLKYDGVLLLEMPYISSKHENRAWFEKSLEHIYYPSGNSLRLLIESLSGYLIGGEVYIRDFASNFVGLAVRNQALISELQERFFKLTSTGNAALTREERLARDLLMLIHAAESTPELISNLPELLQEAANPALLQRVEQLWENDLRRLAAARQAHEDARAQLQQALQTGNRLQAELAVRDGLLATARVERDAARAALAARDGELAMIRTEREALQRRLEEVLNSTAWKATYPFRRLGARHPPTARLIGQGLRLARRRRAQRKLRSRPGKTSDVPEASPDAASHPIPPLVFSGRNGLLHPIRCDDEIEPWPAGRPLVSVVIPSFNYGRFVGEAVGSVLAQTFTNLEVIVVEGGSTDPQSRRTTLALDRPRTCVIAQNEPHPAGANRNFGICQARGKYICCLDADDMLASTYIEKAVFLLEFSGYDVVSTATQFFGTNDERVDILEAPGLADMLEANHILTCAVFRRSLWRRAGGFRDTEPSVTGHVPEDWMFWVRLAALGARMRNICREYLFLYRRHGPSLSTRLSLPEVVQRVLIKEANADLLHAKTPARHAYNASAPPRSAKLPSSLATFAGSADQRRPALLLALPSMILGGAERLLSRIAAYLTRKGWRVAIVTSLDAGTESGDTTHWFAPATAEIYHLPRFLAQDQWRHFVRYLICSRSTDVLWIVGSAFCYDLLPALRAEFPSLAVADLLFNTVGHTVNNRKHARLIDLTFVENREVLRFLQDRGERADRIALVPSGVDLDAFRACPRDPAIAQVLGAAADELIVGYCGRWSAEKDPLAFIEIAQCSLATRLPLHFVMTGGGPMRGAIIEAVRRAALPESRFRLLGEVEDLLPWLRSCDVLVVPSKLDGRPVVVLEALASGVPVLASRVGALPELIEDGVTGFLCQPGDVDAFVDRLARLASDRELLARMKTCARRFAERHLSEHAMLSEYESSLRKIISARHSRTPVVSTAES